MASYDHVFLSIQLLIQGRSRDFLRNETAVIDIISAYAKVQSQIFFLVFLFGRSGGGY